MILAQFNTYIDFDHKINTLVILLFLLIQYVHKVLVNCSVKFAKEISVVMINDHLDMTTPVDCDVKPQTKQTNKQTNMSIISISRD